MNKYQDALDYLNKCIVGKHGKACLSIVKELVDKETQMKPIEGEGFTVHDCPTCDDGYIEVDGYYKLNRCVNCGQKIDWSDEE